MALSATTLYAQTLQPFTWQAYGVSFKAPAGYTIEDDSEEGLYSQHAYLLYYGAITGRRKLSTLRTDPGAEKHSRR